MNLSLKISTGVTFAVTASLWLSHSPASSPRAANLAGVDAVAEYGAVDPRLGGKAPPQILPDYPMLAVDPIVSPNVLVNSRSLCPDGHGLQQNETSIAVSGDAVLVAYNDARGGYCPDRSATVGWSYSLNGGQTFIQGGALPRSALFNNGDPWVGVSPDGNTFYLSGMYNGFQAIGFLRGSVRGGALIWEDPPTVIQRGEMDKEAFVVDPNSGLIYLTFTSLSAGGIQMISSSDQGRTWSAPVLAAPGFGATGSFPAVDNLGNIYLAVNYGNPGTSQVTAVQRSRDGGATFQMVYRYDFSTRPVSFVDRSPNFPQLGIDNSFGERDGWLYLVWDKRDPDNVRRVYIAVSADGGDSWSGPTPVSSEWVMADQWYPTVAVDAFGNVNVVMLDRRNNPGTGFTNVYFAQSSDGAVSFAETRVTDVTANWAQVGYDPRFTYFGDYIRAVSSGGDVLAAWMDPRNGDPDVYFARISSVLFAESRR